MDAKSYHLVDTNNVVVNTILLDPDNVELVALFQKEHTLVDAANGGAIGDVYNPTTGSIGPAPLPVPTKEELLAFLAALRYERETQGITINGKWYSTSRASQGLINGAYNAARDATDPNMSFDFVLDNSTTLSLTASEVIGLGQAMYKHVQACFTTQGVFIKQISADEHEYQSLDELSAAFTAYYTSLMAIP